MRCLGLRDASSPLNTELELALRARVKFRGRMIDESRPVRQLSVVTVITSDRKYNNSMDAGRSSVRMASGDCGLASSGRSSVVRSQRATSSIMLMRIRRTTGYATFDVGREQCTFDIIDLARALEF
jgi:hypothetical protein